MTKRVARPPVSPPESSDDDIPHSTRGRESGSRPREHDPATPLTDERFEKFVALVAQGHSQTAAYRIAVNPKTPRRSARVRASELAKRPEVAARLEMLRSVSKIAKRESQPKGIEPPTTPPTEELDSPLTLDEAKRKITFAVRKAKTPMEITQAVREATRLLHLDLESKRHVPDPVEIVSYVAQSAGRPHREIAREMGGLRWMIERVLELAHAPPSEVCRTLRAMVRSITNEAQPVIDTDSIDRLSDVESDSVPKQDDSALPASAPSA